MDRLRFQSFASGSSGNCYFVGNFNYGILIDAGIGIKTIRKCLKNLGLDTPHIVGVLVTHDHADHIKSVGILGEKYNVPVYTTEIIHSGISSSYCVTEKLTQSKRLINKEVPFQVGDFKVTAFPVSHDASDCIGFSVEYKGKTITFATDLGYINEEAKIYLKNSDFLVIEANYDEQMLEDGKYPNLLKQRIKADTGHLSNVQCAQFLAENYSSRWQYIFLCHLSRENNMPFIAYETVVNELKEQQIKPEVDVKLVALSRFTPSEHYSIQVD